MKTATFVSALLRFLLPINPFVIIYLRKVATREKNGFVFFSLSDIRACPVLLHRNIMYHLCIQISTFTRFRLAHGGGVTLYGWWWIKSCAWLTVDRNDVFLCIRRRTPFTRWLVIFPMRAPKVPQWKGHNSVHIRQSILLYHWRGTW